jgi:hypothetical protein
MNIAPDSLVYSASVFRGEVNMTKKFLLGLTLFIAVIAVSCKKEEPVPQTNLRFVHASANAPTLDYSINNTLFIGNNSYPASTSYRATVAGSVTVKVSQSGSTTGLFNITGNFVADKFYSVFLFDSVANLKISTMEDDRTAPPTGKCFVRFLHLGTGQGPVDIIRAGGPIRLFTNRSFNDHSTTPSVTAYTAIDPGPFSVSAIVAGSANTLVTQLPSFEATAGKSYTLYLRGFRNATPLTPQVLFLSAIADN